MPIGTEHIRIFRSPLTDAQDAADVAMDRLRGRLAAMVLPTDASGMDFGRWAAMARRAAPEEMKEFLDACMVVKRLMEDE
jgi:hypothetical protein